MWTFNPGEPNAEPTRAGVLRTGTGTGDVVAVPPAFVIDVAFGETPFGFQYYPEAAGQWVLHRKVIHSTPYKFLHPTGGVVNFCLEDLGVAVWEARSPDAVAQGFKWRLAYNWPWGRIADDWGDQSIQQGLAALGPLLAQLATYGMGFPDIDDLRTALANTPALPDDFAWVCWYGPEYWRAAHPMDLSITFPYYTRPEVSGQKNACDPLTTRDWNRSFGGNHLIAGIFQTVEFPATLAIQPCWH